MASAGGGNNGAIGVISCGVSAENGVASGEELAKIGES